MTSNHNKVAVSSNWTETTISQVCEPAQYGFTASAESLPVGPRMLRITDIQAGRVDWDAVPYCQCSEPEKYLLQPGDILFARTGATTGKSYLVKECPNSVFASYLIRLRPKEIILPEFLYWFFQSPQYWVQITEQKQGTGQPGVNASKLGKLVIKFPPKDEQRRIVARIEELMERSQRARGALNQIPLNLGQMERALMQLAFYGDLTAAWRKANSTTETPLDLRQPPSVSAAREAGMYELPEGWSWTTLGAVTRIKGGIQKGKKRKGTESLFDVPYLRVANVQRGWLDLSEITTMPVTQDELDALRLEPGDVLLNEGGDKDKLGRGWIWEGQIENCIHQNHVFRARPIPGLLHPKLISWYANSFGQEFFFRQGKQTTGLASISMSVLAALPVPLMPWHEQLVLVRIVEDFLERQERLRATARVSDQLERLETAILAKAFGGSL